MPELLISLTQLGATFLFCYACARNGTLKREYGRTILVIGCLGIGVATTLMQELVKGKI